MSGYTVTGSQVKSWKSEDFTLKASKHFNLSGADDEGKKRRWLNDKDSTNKKNSSTLSLHIAAYEKLIEASNGKSENLQKKSVAFKPILSLPKIQEPFEFPRQMDGNKPPTAPEIQQFKASQTLLSPKQEAGGKDSNVKHIPHPGPVSSVKNMVRDFTGFVQNAISSRVSGSESVLKCDLERTSSTASISGPLALLGIGDPMLLNEDDEKSLDGGQNSISDKMLPEKKSPLKMKEEPSTFPSSVASKPKSLKRLLVDSPIIEAKKENYLVSDMIHLLQQASKPKSLFLYFEDRSCMKLVKNNKGQFILNAKLLDRNGLSVELVAFPPLAEMFEKRLKEIPSQSVIKISTDYYFYWPPNPFVASLILHKVILGPRATITSCLATSDSCLTLPTTPDLFDLRHMIYYRDVKYVLNDLELVDVITDVMAVNETSSVVVIANSDSLAILKFGVSDPMASSIKFGIRLKIKNVQFSYSNLYNDKFNELLGEKLGPIPSHVPMLYLTSHSNVDVTDEPAGYLLENVSDLKFWCPIFLNQSDKK